ncbi:MAG: hypothetical protein AAFX51_03540, partial [Cyanobacteria bacterium J06636_28]
MRFSDFLISSTVFDAYAHAAYYYEKIIKNMSLGCGYFLQKLWAEFLLFSRSNMLHGHRHQRWLKRLKNL